MANGRHGINLVSRKLISGICLTSVILASCATGQQGIGQAIGSIAMGGVCLALVDSNHRAACIAAAAAGFVIGGAIGHKLDERDKKRRQQALLNTLNDDNKWDTRKGQGPLSPAAINANPVSRIAPSQNSESATETTWVNPDTQNAGRIEPLRSYVGGRDGREECRQFRETYFKNGEPITDAVVECKDAQGTWVEQ